MATMILKVKIAVVLLVHNFLIKVYLIKSEQVSGYFRIAIVQNDINFMPGILKINRRFKRNEMRE